MYSENSPNYLSIIKNKYITNIPEKKNLLYLLCYIIVKRKESKKLRNCFSRIYTF